MFNRPTCEQFYEKYKQPKDVVDGYKQRMRNFLQHKYPSMREDVIDGFIGNVVDNRMADKEVAIVQHDKATEVYTERKGSLLKLTNVMMNKLIHSPSGSCFQSSTEVESFHSGYIKYNQNQRKIVKKDLHKAEADHNKKLEHLLNNEQMNIKININAVSGVMNSVIWFKSRFSYNAITAASRYGITIGYGTIERFITGNFFFKSADQVVGYIIRMKELFPGTEILRHLRHKHNLYQPTHQELYNQFVMDSLAKYTLINNPADQVMIHDVISRLTEEQVMFCYYGLNMFNMVSKNIDIFKTCLDDLYRIKADVIREYEGKTKDQITNLKSLKDVTDSDVSMFAAVFCLDMLNYKPLNKIEDEVVLSKFAEVCERVEKHLDSVFTDFFVYFFNINYLLHNVFEHKEMMRKTTLLSDTDSVIFTMQELVKMMYGSLEVNDETLTINAFFIILAFKHLEHVFNLYSVRMNVDPENYARIQIKNEFMYISLLRMATSKTYIGINRIKEGTYVDPPKLDIKGTIFKTSSLKASVKKEFNEWITWLLKEPANGQPVSMEAIRTKLIEMERKILDCSDAEYLTTTPIKDKTDYKIPEQSAYFNYIVWREVFEPDYVEKVYLPMKFAKLPLKNELKLKNYEKYLGPLRGSNKVIYDRLIKVLAEYPKKTITSLYIPLGVSIPADIKYLVDYSTIVSNNMKGFYVALCALGFGFPEEKNNKKTLHDYLEDDNERTIRR